MNKVKVIKKSVINELDYSFKTNEVNLKSKSKQREAIKTVENWIADWRAAAEIKTRRAFEELTRLKLQDSL